MTGWLLLQGTGSELTGVCERAQSTLYLPYVPYSANFRNVRDKRTTKNKNDGGVKEREKVNTLGIELHSCASVCVCVHL